MIPENDEATAAKDSGEDAGLHSPPPAAPSGLTTRLQPSGTAPGGSPAAIVGSIGTGGGSTGNKPTGNAGGGAA
jgi:hypothetical protein